MLKELFTWSPSGRLLLPRLFAAPWPPEKHGTGSCCCPSSSPSSPGTGICHNCAKFAFSDDFNYSATAAQLIALHGYTNTLCTGDVANGYSAASGALVDIKPGATPPMYLATAGGLFQTITTPALSGLCISVCAQVTKVLIPGTASGGVVGVIVANAAFFFARATFNTFATASGQNASGCPSSPVSHIFGTWDYTKDAPIISLVIEDTSGGGGQYSAKSYVNGTLLDTFTNQSYTFTPGAGLLVGVRDTNGGSWTNLQIYTS